MPVHTCPPPHPHPTDAVGASGGRHPAPSASTHPTYDTARSEWLSLVSMAALVLALSFAAGLLPGSAGSLTAAWFGRALAPLTSPAFTVPTTSSAATTSPPPPTTTLGAPATPTTCSDGSRTAFGKDVLVGQDEWICGSVTVFGANATINGAVNGGVTVADGNVTISGRVNGSVTVLHGDVTLRYGAAVYGGVQVIGGTVHRDAQTHISGPVEDGLGLTNVEPLRWLGFTGPFSFPWGHLLFWGLVGAALAAFYPRQLRRVERAVSRTFPFNVLLGALAWLVGALLAALLFITCLGIPLALLLVAGLYVASVVGTIASGLWLGGRLLGGRETAGRGAPIVATMLGVMLIELVKAVPCVGGVVTVAMACLGLGASLLALLSSRRTRHRELQRSWG